MSVLLKLFGVNAEEEFQSSMSVLGKLFSREYFHCFMSVLGAVYIFLKVLGKIFVVSLISAENCQSFISVFQIVFIAPCQFRGRSPKLYVSTSNDVQFHVSSCKDFRCFMSVLQEIFKNISLLVSILF